MYVGLAVLWTLIIRWVGIKAGRSIESASLLYGRISGDLGQLGAPFFRRIVLLGLSDVPIRQNLVAVRKQVLR